MNPFLRAHPVPELDARVFSALELAPGGANLEDVAITIDDAGITLASVGRTGVVPTLATWERVVSASLEEPDDLVGRDGGTTSPGDRVLTIEIDDGAWPVQDRARRLLVTSAEAGALAQLLEAGRVKHTTVTAPEQVLDPTPPEGVVLAAPVPHHHRIRRSVAAHRWAVVGIVASLVALVAAFVGAGTVSSAADTTTPSGHALVASVTHGLYGNRLLAENQHAAALAAASSAPEPLPPTLANSGPLRPHEVFGFAPYWTLPDASSYPLDGLTTIAYFAVGVHGDGTLDESGAGWDGYKSQDLVDLVDRAHAAGVRVVLTVNCFDQGALDAITHSSTAAATLSAALISAIEAKDLDGVNFDFEGEGSADQAGLTALLTQVSKTLKTTNPNWQVSMATYASAAGDSGGFYNVAALAPAMDAFFVMAYDMNSRTSPSATSPLVGGSFSDTLALQQYTAVVPASKVILGLPYYGYDWPTTNGTLSAQATGSENPLSDAVIAASGHPTYWDPSTQTAWTSYQVGSQWHETFFDNPTSLALKAELANSFNVAGVGIWALGMDGNNPAMLAALLGNAPPAKDYSPGPTSTTPTTVPGTGFVTSGTFENASVTLAPVSATPSSGTAELVGTMSTFTTTDPALSCLGSGPVLSVWTFSALPGEDVVVAEQPQDCASAVWSFIPPTSTTTSSTSSTTTTAPSDTTTSSSTTTTTSTTDPSSTSTTTTTDEPSSTVPTSSS